MTPTRHPFTALALGAAVASCTPAAAGRIDPDAETIRRHAVPLRSVDPADVDWSDLEPFRERLEGVRVVLLGEPSHGDGRAFLAKTRLIRWLHEEMGFDLLLFESGLATGPLAWRALKDGEPAHEAAARCVFPVWTRTEQARALWDLLAESSRSARPLELGGFDCQLTGSAAGEPLRAALREFAQDGEPTAVDGETWDLVEATLRALVEHAGAVPRDPASRDRHLAALGRLEAGLRKPELVASRGRDGADWWRQVAASTAALARDSWNPPADREAAPLADVFNPRDAASGDNLVWLVTRRHPGRRIIVWAATMHLVRDAEGLTPPTEPDRYRGVVTAGEHLANALGPEAYVIAPVAGGGRAAPFHRPAVELSVPPADSFEALALEAGLDDALVDLRGLPAGHWLRSTSVAAPLAYSPMKARWPEQVDAFLFHRRMTPATHRLRPEQRRWAENPIAGLEEEWQRVLERRRRGHSFAEKLSLVSGVVPWLQVAAPEAAAIRELETAVEEWAREHEGEDGFTWRVEHVLARLAAERGDRASQARRLEAAIAAHPRLELARPGKQSQFQHLVNERAFLLWEEEDLGTALTWTNELLKRDARFEHVHAFAWFERLEAAERAEAEPRIRAALRAALRARRTRFPEQAAAIDAQLAALDE